VEWAPFACKRKERKTHLPREDQACPTLCHPLIDRHGLLARIMHDHFCCNRRCAATTGLRPAGSPLGPSTYSTSTHGDLRVSRAGLATRLIDFATNHQ